MAPDDDVAITWTDEEPSSGTRAGEVHQHRASGLMPAQNDAAVEEVAPEQVADRDAFGRTPDER